MLDYLRSIAFSLKKSIFAFITLSNASLLDRIKSTIPGKINPIHIYHPGIKYPFFVRVNTVDIVTYSQIFKKGEYDLPYKEPIEVIIDAGANIGLASIYFANRYPTAKIIAIEPDKSNFELLSKNVLDYSNIVPIKAALWNTSGTVNLLDPGIGSWGYRTDNQEEINKIDSLGCVKSITIHDIINEHQLKRIDLLKVDIEGAEKELFSNSKNWITLVESIVIELHEHMKTGCITAFDEGTKEFKHKVVKGENIYIFR